MMFIQKESHRGFQLLNFAEFVFLSVFFMALLTGTQMLSIDSDLGRHLVLGNYILDHRTIPTQDILSFTLAGESRPPYEWLSQVIFALAHRLVGLDGVVLLTATLLGSTLYLLFQHTNQRSGSSLISLLLILLAIAATSIHWLPRPHMVTILILPLWIDRLERLRKGETTRIFIFPCIMLFWANLHGGFVFGFLAWAAYVASWAWEYVRGKATIQNGRSFMAAGIFSLATSIITPDLWRNWEAVLNNRSAYILSRTVETMPPVLTDLSVIPFTIQLLLAIVLFAMFWRTIPASHVALLGGLGFMSLLMTRNIPLFAVASVPILAELLQRVFARLNFWSRIEERFAGFRMTDRLPLIPLIAILFAGIYFAYHKQNTNSSIYQFSPQTFPIQAVDWLDENPQQGNMFNEFNWGGYLLYRLWPQQTVFVDSQSDFYGEPLIKEYESILLAHGDWRMSLEMYEVDWAIIPPQFPLAAELKELGWIPTYEDSTAVILVKK